MRTSSGPDSVHQHLGRFASAGILAVVLLAWVVPAAAEIIYTPTNLTIGPGGEYKLDLNNDGVTDFTITNRTTNGVCGGSVHAAVAERPASGNGAEGSPPAELILGDPIGPSQTFGGKGNMVHANLSCAGTVHEGGSWDDNGDNGYLGLSFQIDGETYYGWAEMNITFVSGKSVAFFATLTGYAYETTPGMPINAGQTTDGSSALRPGLVNPPASGLVAVSNPARAVSLGAPVLGAQEVPLWRRKESAEATPEDNNWPRFEKSRF